MEKLLMSRLFSFATFLIMLSLPVRQISMSNFSCASIAPFMISRGALSPPKASTTIFTINPLY